MRDPFHFQKRLRHVIGILWFNELLGRDIRGVLQEYDLSTIEFTLSAGPYFAGNLSTAAGGGYLAELHAWGNCP